MTTSMDMVNKINPEKEAWNLKVRGCKIQATIRKTMIYRFKQLLSEGRVYVMKLFSVVPNQGSYRATRHQFKLIFQFRTTVRDAICGFIPKSARKISPFTELLETKEDSDFLVDVVGLLVSVSEEKEYDKDGKKMKMAVMELAENELGHKIRYALFGEYVDELNRFLSSGYAEQPVVVLQHAKVKAGTFVVLAKIAEIVEDGPWWYSACVCGRGVQAESGIYFCQFCNIHVTNVTARFRMKVLVEDSTGISIFVLFDREASYLLNKTCAWLFEQHLKDVDVLSRPVGMEKFKGSYPVRRVCDDAAIVGMFKLSGSDLSPKKAGFVPKGEGSFGEPSKVTKSPNLGLNPSSCSELFASSPQCTQKESSVVDLGVDEDDKCPFLKRKFADAVVDKLNEVDSSENSCDEVDESEEYVVGINRGSIDAEKDVKPSLKRLRRSLRLQFDEADESRGSGNDGSSGHGVN
ncbi:hypothetical protein Ahy_A07g033882 [Arachis hypogaea]|uniref:Replication factor A C-terminal domain-containing protein n=1 Tax=Arachis hypogaea TaxID=3818 RepID=A0A445CAA9_ARAHY|nr:hypothetical protein Ahy_A07g033882 [Arachis hypogaea]